MRFRTFAVILLFAFSSNAYAVLGIGASTKDELMNMKKVAELEEELARNHAISAYILDLQEKQKETLITGDVRKEMIQKVNKLKSKITKVKDAIKEYERAMEDLPDKKEMLRKLEREGEIVEADKTFYKFTKYGWAAGNVLTNGLSAVSDASFVFKGFATKGKEASAASYEDAAQKFKKASQELDNLYKETGKLREAIKKLEETDKKLVKSLEKLEKLQADLAGVRDDFKSIDEMFTDLYKGALVEPFSDESVRISESMAKLLKEIKCKSITRGLRDLTINNLRACKKASWDKIKIKASKAPKCKKIDVLSSSVDIEYCLREYVSKYK
jgi:peptidoglycan hydrolase CwlO-like protein